MKKLILHSLLVLFSFSCYAGNIDTLNIHSASMNKEIKNIVITPKGYGSGTNQYPVLYLLHGATGNYASWSKRVPKITDYADTYNIIIVCPDGGYTSWYFDSPIDRKMRYETFISKELITAVDTKYNTIKSRKGRAITGLSMGGHGAFYLAFRHQDTWGAVGSMSGGVDLRPFPNNWDISKRIGTYATSPEVWEKSSIINMVHLLDGKSLKIIFDCGINDFFHQVNLNMHKKLIERNIPHDYTERPGKHNWKYWGNAIKYQLIFFNDFFQQRQ